MFVAGVVDVQDEDVSKTWTHGAHVAGVMQQLENQGLVKRDGAYHMLQMEDRKAVFLTRKRTEQLLTKGLGYSEEVAKALVDVMQALFPVVPEVEVQADEDGNVKAEPMTPSEEMAHEALFDEARPAKIAARLSDIQKMAKA